MAMSFKEKRDIRAELLEIITDIKNHKFAPVYLICGDEPYYGDLIIDALSEYVLQPQEKDFNFRRKKTKKRNIKEKFKK